MNDMSVPSFESADAVLDHLSDRLADLSPELRKAASYLLENPNTISLSSLRELGEAADVKPNSFVRMARQVGFDGFEELRAPFKTLVREGGVSFPDRARWLQSLAEGGQLAGLYRDMAEAAIRNIEETFANVGDEALLAAANDIWNCRKVYTLGVGINASNAQNFTYLASTGLNDFVQIPKPGSTPIDDLARADQQDTLIAMTCKPYRAEVVEAVALARDQGMKIVAIADSPASPIALNADHILCVSAETPQFFPSSVSIIALLETLLSFVIAVASPEVVERVDRFHQRRHTLGIYQRSPDE
ncbi:MAG: MurR/RpiR family transcriptional regulator [Pseudomonadota bacterium]